MAVDTSALAAFNGEVPPDTDAPEPPRVPWLNEDGTPRWGLKADGTPRHAPAGPGRGGKKDPADKPRTTDAPTEGKPKTAAGPPKDYTAELQSAGVAVWVGLSSTPWTKAHARLWQSQIPGLAAGFNEGAKNNATMRRYVEKVAGEGSVLWVLPLATSMASLAAGSWQIIQDRDLRRELAAANDTEFQAFVAQQARAMGLAPEEPATEQPSAGVCQNPSHDLYGHNDCKECPQTSPEPSGTYSPAV